MKRLLEEIRASEERVRKRWLIGLSSVTMAIVIGLWLVYINVLVGSETEVEISDNKDLVQSPGIAQTFKAGLVFIIDKLKTSSKGALGYLGNIFNYSNEINITQENLDRNFILDSIEKIYNTNLP